MMIKLKLSCHNILVRMSAIMPNPGLTNLEFGRVKLLVSMDKTVCV